MQILNMRPQKVFSGSCCQTILFRVSPFLILLSYSRFSLVALLITNLSVFFVRLEFFLIVSLIA